MLSDRSCRLVITGHPTKSAAPKPDAGTSNALCPHKDQPCMVINMASKQDEDEVNLPTNGPLVEIKNGFANVRFGSKFRGLKGIKVSL